MPMTPIVPGTTVYVSVNDPADTSNVQLVVTMCEPLPAPVDGDDYKWTDLCIGFGSENEEAFLSFMWFIRSAAAFHHLQVECSEDMPEEIARQLAGGQSWATA